MSETSSTFQVPSEMHDERLDRVLAARLPGHSRSRFQRLMKAGLVTVDGAAVQRPSTPVAAGAEVRVQFPPDDQATTATGEVVAQLTVLYEDEHLAVIDKPAGLVSHPNERFTTGTVADLAQERWGPLPEAQGDDRPGIVHRLDRMTSGVMLLGLSEQGMVGLKQQFHDRLIEKEYVAVVHGVPRFDSDWVDVPIVRVSRQERLRAGKEGEGREASTLIECVERMHGFAKLLAKPKTGRTHQIRVHLSHLKLPIVGDRLYGPRGPLKVPLPQEAPVLVRQALHAASIGFTHPVSGEAMKYELPLPADMEELLAWLREHMPPRPV